MNTLGLLTRIIQRPLGSASAEARWRLQHARARALKAYADFRVGATRQEKRAYHRGESVLLTFDDYGTAGQVHRLLEILREANVQAMVFAQGDWADREPGLVAQIAAAGHVVGNHTYSHPDLLALNDDEVRREIAEGPASQWLRPPRGRYDARIRRLAAELGYRICYWTIDSDDWQGVPAEAMSRKILAELHSGAVILFHIHGTHTLELLPGLIGDIRARGYRLAEPGEALWEDAV